MPLASAGASLRWARRALAQPVHPQTVRYRLRQITELFGDRLSDPDARFALQAALRVRRLMENPVG